MNLIRNPGRVAGLWYLLLVVLGPLRLIYIPETLYVHGNAAATVSNLAAHARLFRLGIADELLVAVVLVFLTLALYRLFKAVSPYLAALVVILGGVIPSVLYLVNAATDLSALMVVRGGDFLSAFDKPQRDALAMLFLRQWDHQFTASEILAGAWLFPLGMLAYKSRFMPRFLGVWLFLGGAAYLILCFAGVLAPEYQNKVFAYSQPALFGEVAFMLWLVIRGAKPPALQAAASSGPAE